MMADEARIAKSLCHPNVVRVEDLIEAEGRPFIVMEYLDGHNLHRDRPPGDIRSGRSCRAPPSARSSPSARRARSRARARRRRRPLLGLVHRDVSPANVIVTWSGRVKLIDFGVAKATSLDDRGLTRVGEIKGKMTYMSPEQVQRDPLDGRSDLFSVGIMLWEMLTQRRLFARKQWMESMTAICLVDAPPPSTYVSDLPPALDRICARALARDRQARYQTAAEMRVELEALIASEGWSASPAQLQAELVTLFPDEAPPLDDGDETPEAEIVLEAEIRPRGGGGAGDAHLVRGRRRGGDEGNPARDAALEFAKDAADGALARSAPVHAAAAGAVGVRRLGHAAAARE